MACKACRTRKIKCDRERPKCLNCKQRSAVCIYSGERPVGCQTARGRYRARVRSKHGDARNDRKIYTQQEPLWDYIPDLWMQHRLGENDVGSTETSFSKDVCPIPATQRLQVTNSQAYDDFRPQSVQSDSLIDKILSSNQNEQFMKKDRATILTRLKYGDEITGPSSSLSFFSDLGLEWVARHVPDASGIGKTIRYIWTEIMKQLRCPKCVTPGPLLPHNYGMQWKPIEQQHVRKYVDAYFWKVQTIFPILDKETFESQMDAFGTSLDGTSNYAWRALLNAVLAAGCRAALSDETTEAFENSGRESWAYFQNALACETEIIHGTTSLLAVEALAVMTVFSQGLSTSQRLEYSLCSITSRLAQGIGMHCEPSSEWNLSEEEKTHRSRVFWAIYCLDKTIALRSGRPSAIRDDEITSHFPRGIQYPSNVDHQMNTVEDSQSHDFFLFFTRLARISSTVSTQLYSATAMHSPDNVLLDIAIPIFKSLEAWKAELPPEFEPDTLRELSGQPRLLSQFQHTVLLYTYYDITSAVYRRFSPWFLNEDSAPLLHQTILQEGPGYIEVASSMVLLTKHLGIDSGSPCWLVVYYPFTALCAIFVHVMSTPPNASTFKHIALMEIVVGFFGRLEYVTSGKASFTPARDFIRQAHTLLNRVENDLIVDTGTISTETATITTPPFFSNGIDIVVQDNETGPGDEGNGDSHLELEKSEFDYSAPAAQSHRDSRAHIEDGDADKLVSCNEPFNCSDPFSVESFADDWLGFL